MNILFLTPESVDPLCGGIARITYLLASEFKKRGHICVSAYVKEKSDKQGNRRLKVLIVDNTVKGEG